MSSCLLSLSKGNVVEFNIDPFRKFTDVSSKVIAPILALGFTGD